MLPNFLKIYRFSIRNHRWKAQNLSYPSMNSNIASLRLLCRIWYMTVHLQLHELKLTVESLEEPGSTSYLWNPVDGGQPTNV